MDSRTEVGKEKKQARFAWCMYDWGNSGFATVILAAVFPVYFAAIIPAEGALFSFFGYNRSIPAAAFWGYLVALATALVALTAPAFGALADRRRWRRRLFIAFATLGIGATALFGLMDAGHYGQLAILFIAAEVGFALGNIFYDSFLTVLASGEADLDRLSARGYAFGYAGGGLALLLAFALIQWHEIFGLADRGSATRTAFLLTGLWWGLFALPAFLRLRESFFPLSGTTRKAGFWGEYFHLFGEIRRHPDLLLFLIAFLFYNDGIQTIIVVSAIFGRTELGLSQTTIMLVFLMIQFIAFPGSLLYGRIAARIGAKRALSGGLLLFIGITIYAYTMQYAWQFWTLGAAVALIYGGCQAISRSLYAAFVPEGKSAEFFAFFTVTSKFAALLGPFVFALVADFTQSSRLSILALSAFFLIGLLLLAGVDVERGKNLVRRELP